MGRSLKATVLTVFLGMMGALLLFADAHAQTGKALTKITQAMPAKDINFLPWYLADKKGFFAAEGLQVELPNMTSQVAIPALLSKQIEFGIGASAARAAYQGAAVHVIMYAYNGFPLLGVAAKGIKSYSDLVGKTVATSTVGGSDDLITRALFEQKKVTGFQIITLGRPTARAAALSSGQIQYTMIDPLTAYQFEQDGFNIIGSASEVHAVPSAGFAVHDDTIKQRPDVVRGWLRATIKALLLIKKEPGAAADFAVAELGLDRNLALKSLKYLSQYIDADDPGGVTEAELVQITADDFAQLNMAGDPAPMARKAHDFTLLHAAQRDLGIKCKTGYQCQ